MSDSASTTNRAQGTARSGDSNGDGPLGREVSHQQMGDSNGSSTSPSRSARSTTPPRQSSLSPSQQQRQQPATLVAPVAHPGSSLVDESSRQHERSSAASSLPLSTAIPPLASSPSPHPPQARREPTAQQQPLPVSARVTTDSTASSPVQPQQLRSVTSVMATVPSSPHPREGSGSNRNNNSSSHIDDSRFSVEKQTNYLRQRDSLNSRPSGGQGSGQGDGQGGPYPEALPGLPMEVIVEQQRVHFQQQQQLEASHMSSNTNNNNNNNTASSSNDNVVSQDWSTGIFDCCLDVPLFVDAILCTYCLSSAHYNNLYREHQGIFWPLCCGLLCIDCCWASTCYCVVANQLHTIIIRRELRRRYHIGGRSAVRQATSTNANSTGGGETASNPPTAAAATTATTTTTVAPTQLGGFTTTLLDIALSCFCVSCTMSQHHREMAAQGQWPGPVVFSRTETGLQMTPTVTTIT